MRKYLCLLFHRDSVGWYKVPYNIRAFKAEFCARFECERCGYIWYDKRPSLKFKIK